MDPARPIRIIVTNGHVTLYGSVDNKMDKDIAGIELTSFLGAFSVITSWRWKESRARRNVRLM